MNYKHRFLVSSNASNFFMRAISPPSILLPVIGGLVELAAATVAVMVHLTITTTVVVAEAVVGATMVRLAGVMAVGVIFLVAVKSVSRRDILLSSVGIGLISITFSTSTTSMLL